MKPVILLSFIIVCTGLLAQETGKLWQPYYITPRTGGNRHLDLSADWHLSYSDSAIVSVPELPDIRDGITVAYPVSIQWALYKAGKLPHPYAHENSKLYEWVEDKLWYYRKEFELPATNGNYVFLCFDGLDYFSRIWLNGELLGRHEGMFGGPQIEISSKLRDGQKNTIVVEVESGNRRPEIRKYYFPADGLFAVDGAKRGEGAPVVKGWAFTGGTGAEHYYTLGMWRGVRIETVPAIHIERPYLVTEKILPGKAVLSFSAELFVNAHTLRYKMHPWGNAILSRGVPATKLKPVNKPLALHIEFLSGGKKTFVKTIPIHTFEGRTWINEQFEMENPRLWWPNGMGEPELYEVRLVLSEGNMPLDEIVFDFGIRTIERKRTAGLQVEEEWENWHFVINGEPMFVRGANWMPADWLLDLTAERYKWLLEMADNAGIQMLRVWGSGAQESNEFYHYCNRMGIMVWQDFQISHVVTPNWPQDVVEAHVMQNVYRLRNQPSLALWNGGNGMNPYASTNSTVTGITERYVRRFDPARFYSRSSSAAGNAHLYPDMDPSWYARLYKYVPFISETGIHSIPSPKNLRRVVDAKEFAGLGNMYSDDFVKNHKEIIHHFAEYNPSRVPRMLSRASHIDDMKNPSIESLSEATQIGAGEFYQVLTDGMFSNYPNSTGLLYWVFNRMWPVFSAIMLVDGHGQPVAPYYFTKRCFEQTHVFALMERLLWASGDTVEIEPFVINHSDNAYPGTTVKLTVLDDAFKPFYTGSQTVNAGKGVSLAKQEKISFIIPESYRDRYFIVLSEMFDAGGKLVSRSVYWPRSTTLMDNNGYKNKYVNEPQAWPSFDKGPWLKPVMAKTGTKLEITEAKVKNRTSDRLVIAVEVKNTGKHPAFMTQLDINEENEYYLSDNFFWLSAGETKKIEMVVRIDNKTPISGIFLNLSAWNVKMQK
ncbi:MAG: hypothetical protein LBS79_06990, partial [Tannerella sp.]|nr:hypothetical protein [Tannerella sp.]